MVARAEATSEVTGRSAYNPFAYNKVIANGFRADRDAPRTLREYLSNGVSGG